MFKVNLMNITIVSFLSGESFKVILNMVNNINNKWTHKLWIIQIIIGIPITIDFHEHIPACGK
ncbi:hypothetical protein ACW63_24055 [Klebsiella quasipneumoniae subsp. quasipneumoniae]|nr:hypothetical protein ACW63_24055 [Klebsiella quasipneumoniae subsp. quasipneumoniae]